MSMSFRISDLLEELRIDNGAYLIKNEHSFEGLGLLESKINMPLCSFMESVNNLSQIESQIVMMLVTPEAGKRLETAGEYSFGLCVVENPRILFFQIHNCLCEKAGYQRGRFQTEIGESCRISDRSSVSKENIKIGSRVIIEPFATVLPNTLIGDDCIIRSGAVVGGSGFEFKRYNGQMITVHHAGGVVLGNNVEIQNNSCVDRAVYPWDDTIIGEGSKIDNLVHIGHAGKIGERVLIAAKSVIGGRVVIRDDTWIGIGAAIRNGLQIGAQARVNMGAVVTKNVEDSGSVTGNFAIAHNDFIENLKKIRG